MNLRIPAGVRIDGMGVGGRFVSVDMLPVLADATDDAGRAVLLELAARELDRAAGRYDRADAKFDDDPRRYAVARADAEAAYDFWQRMARDLVQEVARPTPAMVERVALDPDEYDVDAVEWEFGVEYLSAGGPASNVDINLRLRRTDGLPFGAAEAMDVMAVLRANFAYGLSHPVPRGYRFAGINWRSPEKGSRRWKSGDDDDLNTLQVILGVAARSSLWRLGSVDR
jgi:hypothetical protein